MRDLPVALTTHVRLTESPTVRNVGRGEMVTWGGTVCVREGEVFVKGKNMCKGGSRTSFYKCWSPCEEGGLDMCEGCVYTVNGL